jgi:hypothetical protein
MTLQPQGNALRGRYVRYWIGNVCAQRKEQLRVTNQSLLIGAAVFIFAFGVFVTVLQRIRHPPATPVITFTGLAGVYLGLCATVEHIRWLYLPCLVLLLGVATTQLRAFRRSGCDDDNRRTAGRA